MDDCMCVCVRACIEQVVDGWMDGASDFNVEDADPLCPYIRPSRPRDDGKRALEGGQQHQPPYKRPTASGERPPTAQHQEAPMPPPPPASECGGWLACFCMPHWVVLYGWGVVAWLDLLLTCWFGTDWTPDPFFFRNVTHTGRKQLQTEQEAAKRTKERLDAKER